MSLESAKADARLNPQVNNQAMVENLKHRVLNCHTKTIQDETKVLLCGLNR